MISADRLKFIAAWSRGLSQHEIDRARAGIVERSFKAHEVVCLRGACLEYWTGVVTGIIKLGTVSRDGREITFTGVTDAFFPKLLRKVTTPFSLGVPPLFASGTAISSSSDWL
jgi:CRP-like cAMP-binding protein